MASWYLTGRDRLGRSFEEWRRPETDAVARVIAAGLDPLEALEAFGRARAFDGFSPLELRVDVGALVDVLPDALIEEPEAGRWSPAALRGWLQAVRAPTIGSEGGSSARDPDRPGPRPAPPGDEGLDDASRGPATIIVLDTGPRPRALEAVIQEIVGSVFPGARVTEAVPGVRYTFPAEQSHVLVRRLASLRVAVRTSPLVEGDVWIWQEPASIAHRESPGQPEPTEPTPLPRVGFARVSMAALERSLSRAAVVLLLVASIAIAVGPRPPTGDDGAPSATPDSTRGTPGPGMPPVEPRSPGEQARGSDDDSAAAGALDESTANSQTPVPDAAVPGPVVFDQPAPIAPHPSETRDQTRPTEPAPAPEPAVAPVPGAPADDRPSIGPVEPPTDENGGSGGEPAKPAPGERRGRLPPMVDRPGPPYGPPHGPLHGGSGWGREARRSVVQLS